MVFVFKNIFGVKTVHKIKLCAHGSDDMLEVLFVIPSV